MLPTAAVVTVKVAVVKPAATVTLGGVVAELLLSDSVTRTPPLGAGALSVTVPVELVPPVTVVGFSTSDDRLGPPADEVKFKPVMLLPLTVTPWLLGEKIYPLLLGVTVYVPLAIPLKM
jgi:hypothetical protein